MRRILAVVVVGSMALLAACGGDDNKGAATSTTRPLTSTSARTTASSSSSVSTSSSTAPSTSTTTPCPPAPPPPTGPLTSPKVGGAQLLTAVALGADKCVDRVTFAFRSKTIDPPSYSVEYQPGPFSQAGSGAPVPVRGQTFLVVRLEPAYSFDFDTGQTTYTGSARIATPGTHHVTEVVKTGDFEAVMTWVIGLETTRPVGLQATADPHRLVVTIY